MTIADVKVGDTVTLHCPKARTVTRYQGKLLYFADKATLEKLGARPDSKLVGKHGPVDANYAVFATEILGINMNVCLRITDTGLQDDENRKVYLESYVPETGRPRHH